MGKKINKVKKKNNKNVLMGIKNFNGEKMLIILLLVIFCVWGILLLIRYFDYNSINKKIDKIEELENNIKLLNDGYVNIENVVKKIDDIAKENNKLNIDINNITNDIEELDSKISKYNK